MLAIEPEVNGNIPDQHHKLKSTEGETDWEKEDVALTLAVVLREYQIDSWVKSLREAIQSGKVTNSSNNSDKVYSTVFNRNEE